MANLREGRALSHPLLPRARTASLVFHTSGRKYHIVLAGTQALTWRDLKRPFPSRPPLFAKFVGVMGSSVLWEQPAALSSPAVRLVIWTLPDLIWKNLTVHAPELHFEPGYLSGVVHSWQQVAIVASQRRIARGSQAMPANRPSQSCGHQTLKIWPTRDHPSAASAVSPFGARRCGLGVDGRTSDTVGNMRLHHY